MKNYLQHPSVRPRHHHAPTSALLRCFLKDTINSQAISYCLLLPQLSRQPLPSLHPLIPLGLSHTAYENYTQKGSFSIYLTQENQVSHCPQSLGEGPREATVIRRWKSGFQLWLFHGVFVTLALPRNLPKFFHTLQHCTLREQKLLPRMDKKETSASWKSTQKGL